MIDIERERIIPLGRAFDHFPGNKSGKRSHRSRGIRAAKDGSPIPGGGREYLEHLRIGGRLYTSIEAVERYAQRLTDAWSNRRGDSLPRSPAAASRAHANVERQLDALMGSL